MAFQFNRRLARGRTASWWLSIIAPLCFAGWFVAPAAPKTEFSHDVLRNRMWTFANPLRAVGHLSDHCKLRLVHGRGFWCFRQRVGRSASSGQSSVEESPEVLELEQLALKAADAWEQHVTDFLDPAVAAAVEDRLGSQADCTSVRAGGYSAAKRVRLVLTREDLVEASGAEVVARGHAVLLRIAFVSGSSDFWPSVLADAGISVSQIGDALSREDCAYVIVAPEFVERAQDVLRGAAGVTSVDVVEDGTVPDGKFEYQDARRHLAGIEQLNKEQQAEEEKELEKQEKLEKQRARWKGKSGK